MPWVEDIVVGEKKHTALCSHRVRTVVCLHHGGMGRNRFLDQLPHTLFAEAEPPENLLWPHPLVGLFELYPSRSPCPSHDGHSSHRTWTSPWGTVLDAQTSTKRHLELLGERESGWLVKGQRILSQDQGFPMFPLNRIEKVGETLSCRPTDH